uniref:NADH dehydrogenase subunit 2 n=1 Tax=Eupolyphaga hanae TaxID=2972401 RepID=UPI00279C0AC2|nr:NADH dehydrogenase subunit 2 [Eupolyphaga hanae]WGO57821.1 NADH dehydrogenase subunit 2 [Eupolyphaga hanae]
MPDNSTKSLLLLTLVGGTLISVSSNSWLSVWMGLEINLLSFIPLMSTTKNTFTTEASLKYFLTQALASSTLLFLVIIKTIMENIPMFINSFSSFLIVIPLMLKSGVAPFHWWFPSVMEGLNWMNSFILMTIQKIAPLVLTSYLLKINSISMIFILSTVIIGAMGGFNQISTRKILTYSSINHLGWLLTAILLGKNIWLTYFVIYTVLTLTIILILSKHKISFINQLTSMNHKTETKFITLSLFLSMGGLPPFLGFFPKWIVIQSMILNNMTITSIVLVLTSLVTLYYYLRICYLTFLITHLKIKSFGWVNKTNIHLTTLLLASLSTMGLLLCPMMINFY